MSTVNEIISKIRSSSIPEGKMLHIGNGSEGWMAQIQNHGTEEVDIKNNSSKHKSGAWGRIWYRGSIKKQFNGPLNVVKNDMIKYLESPKMSGGDAAMKYDPIMCMMVPAKDEMFKKGDKYKNKNGAVIEIDYYDKNGEVQYRHNKQAQSATEKGLKNMLEKNGYVKDQRTVDFSSSDAKAVFKYLDGDVERTLVNYRKGLNNCKISADCERLENDIRKAMDNIVNEYFQIWNEVGAYAQKKKNEVIKEFVSLSTEVFKKYNSLSDK